MIKAAVATSISKVIVVNVVNSGITVPPKVNVNGATGEGSSQKVK